MFNIKLRPDSITAKDSISDIAVIVGAGSVFYGLSLVIQDRMIWDNPAYDTARLLPYSPASWGFVLATAGTVLLAGLFAGINILAIMGATIGAAWSFFFSFSLFVEFFDDNINLAPGAVYVILCLVYADLAITYRRKNALRKDAP